LRRGELFSDHFATNLLFSLLVKIFFLICEHATKLQVRLIVSHTVCFGTILLKVKNSAISFTYDMKKLLFKSCYVSEPTDSNFSSDKYLTRPVLTS